jgi:2-phospho-L-lactate guanylyltransferase
VSSCVLVVPLRDFDTAKTRLSDVLSGAQRRDLATLCARRVLDRKIECHRIVVCDSDAVEDWARDQGIDRVRVTATGLNAALTESIDEIRLRYPTSDLVIAHGDIVDPTGLDTVVSTHFNTNSDVLIVPDRRRDGTNVLRLAAHIVSEWTFEYGPGSFERHYRQALTSGWTSTIHEDDGLAIDLDTPEDLCESRVRAFLAAHFPEWSLPLLENGTPISAGTELTGTELTGTESPKPETTKTDPI